VTHQEILATIESLPKTEQFSLATSILDRLASDGAFAVSGAVRAEFERRERCFDANPNEGEPWEKVRAELFGQ